MNKPRKLSGAILGLIGAGALLGVWAFREFKPANKVPAEAILPSTTAPAPERITPEPSAAFLRDPEIAPTVEKTLPKNFQSLQGEITTALASADAAAWERVLNELFPALLVADRTAAIRLVETLPPGERRTLLLRRLARAWGAADFAGAVTWISNLADFSEQKAAFDEACLATAETNPAEAIRAWESFDFKEDDHVLENLVQNWARLDFPAAQAWVHERPASIQRDQAVARLAYVLAQTKPVDAANLIVRELAEGPAQTEAVISILHQWAKNDLPGATAWTARFPPGPLADRAKSELAGLSQQPVTAPSSP